MTFAIFIVLFLGFFVTVLNYLPVVTSLPLDLSTSLNLIVGYVQVWNFLFPVVLLFQCAVIVFGFQISIWIWRALKYVVSVIRGNQSGS